MRLIRDTTGLRHVLSANVRKAASAQRRFACAALLLALAALVIAGCSSQSHGASSAKTTLTSKAVRASATPGVTMVHWSAPLNQPDVPTQMQTGFTSAPSNPQIAYSCVGDPVTKTTQQRFFKTVNGAQTWQAVSAAPNPGLPCTAFIDRTNANDIFLQQVLLPLTNAGDPLSATFWRSQDGGTTWAQLALPSHSNGWRDFEIIGQHLVGAISPVYYGASGCNNALLGGGGSDIYTSNDGGHTWTQVGQNLISQGISLDGLVAAGSVLFANGQTRQTSCDQTVYNTYWESSDVGATWTTTTLPTNTNIANMSFTAQANGQGYYGIAVEQPAASSSNATTGVPYTILISDDSGASWRPAPTFNTQPGAPITTFSAQFLDLSRTPAGDAVVAIWFLPGTSSTAYLYYLPLHNGAPRWFQYTPGNVNYELGWQILHTAQGDILQVTGYDPNQQKAVATVPLPA
ncbi:MAG TPA: hypothetical protein VMV29_09735 [Ktedonobacterales bacterium]|nr:hypothetical protein [Ktedonobacterales bacterium]